MNPAVKTIDLTKTYGEGETEVRALRDVSLEIPKGELAVLLGPSGSGKTTLLNQIGALEEPTSGTVEADGVVLADLDDKGRTAYRLNSIGFVFQFYNLLPVLSAVENVELPLLVSGVRLGEARKRALESLAQLVGLYMQSPPLYERDREQRGSLHGFPMMPD